MNFIYTLIIGLLIGAVAKLLMPGKDPGGCIITMLLGLAGSAVGGWLGSLLGLQAAGGFGLFIGGVIGAIILLLIYRLILGRKK